MKGIKKSTGCNSIFGRDGFYRAAGRFCRKFGSI